MFSTKSDHHGNYQSKVPGQGTELLILDTYLPVPTLPQAVQHRVGLKRHWQGWWLSANSNTLQKSCWYWRLRSFTSSQVKSNRHIQWWGANRSYFEQASRWNGSKVRKVLRAVNSNTASILTGWGESRSWGQRLSWNRDLRPMRNENVAKAKLETAKPQGPLSPTCYYSADVGQAHQSYCDRSHGAANRVELTNTVYCTTRSSEVVASPIFAKA